jgi:hypothetical protein
MCNYSAELNLTVPVKKQEKKKKNQNKVATKRSPVSAVTGILPSTSSSNTLNVVVFEEIGLAESNPTLPLKCLHRYLDEPQESFVGLSNWALDTAKTNRAVVIFASPPSEPNMLSMLEPGSLENGDVFKMILSEFVDVVRSGEFPWVVCGTIMHLQTALRNHPTRGHVLFMLWPLRGICSGG